MAVTAQFSNANWPTTSVHMRGQASLNGAPSGPKDSIVTIGGFMDAGDAYNTLSVYKYATVVSALPSTPDQFVIGKPTSGYFVRGVLIQDESILYNEPFKPDGYLLGTPTTSIQKGKILLTDWTKTATGSIDPTISSIPIFSLASGFIEFVPFGTASAPTGFGFLTKPNGTVNGATVSRTDPLFGSGTAGGVEVSVDII